LALALAGAISFSAAMATTNPKMTVDEMADAAEVAVVAKVLGSRTAKTDNGVVTITLWQSVTDVWGMTPGLTFEVTTQGGSFNSGKFKLSEVSPGAPLVTKSGVALLLLDRDASGTLTIVGFNQGNLQVLKANQVVLPGSGLMSLDAAMAELKSAKLAPAATNDLAR
jgi:hypothetical protein